MHVNVEDVSSVKKALHIEVPEEDVKRELDDAYKTLKKTAKIKGFRPGKTPRSVLERMYKKDVNADVSSKLIQTSFVEAVRETGLNVLGTPDIEPPELQSGHPYAYDAVVEIHPELADVDFKGLELEKTIYQASDEELENQLKMMQKNMASQQTVEEERPVKDGDFVLIDHEGFKDGEPFAETGFTENFTMKIGDGQISKDLDDKLIGMTAGETRDVEVALPEDYFNDKLAGLTITFKVKLNEIREQILPEIDDELAKKMGRYETLDELKKVIRDNLQQGYDKRSEQEMNEQIFKALISQQEFEVPEILIHAELDNIIAEAERSFSYYNKSFEEMGISRETLSGEYRETAEKQVRRYLILNKIIGQEKLEVSDTDLENGYQEMADNFKHSVEEIKEFYKKNGDKVENFKHSLLEKQAIGLIIEESTVTEVKPEKQPQEEIPGENDSEETESKEETTE
ncbi:MAG: trigger factor [Deltaproteobacteria bacterium]|nr:trigger factor [Deltaproteobacteria bacterium]